MRILVVSDTHRKDDNYYKLLKRAGHLDLIIHCGDAEGSETALAAAADCPVWLVQGNNDFFCDLPRELEFYIGKYKFWVTHGHHYYVSMGTEFLKKEAKSRDVDVVLFGHTHRPVVDMETEGVIAANPGSLSYPRQADCRPSYLLIEIDREEELHFTIAYFS